MNILQFKKKFQSINSQLNYSTNSKQVPPVGIKAIGIDLGTTNSVVSIFSQGDVHPVTLNYEGVFLVPSIVYYDKEKDEDLVGLKAKDYIEVNPSEVIKSTKRSMGKNKTTYFSNGKEYSPEETASLVLKYLISHPLIQEEKEKYGKIWAVITVPAHFDDAARLATLSAAENIGIQVLRIVNEPTAAALAYSLLPEEKDVSKENLAVFDFGGGTFDVSIVGREGFVFNVLSSEGDVELGGDDIDYAIADFLTTKVLPIFSAKKATKESEIYRNLLNHAENAKKSFQFEGIVQITDNDLDGKGASLDVSMTREQFDEIIAPILQRTLTLTESALHAAKRSPKQISRILLVGGSTRLTLVRSLLENYFFRPVDSRLEPDLAVSWGASLQAAIIIGIQPEIILVDVCSHTLGIGVIESHEAVQENFQIVSKKLGIPYPISDDDLRKRLGTRMDEFNFELQKMLHVAPILYRNSALPTKRSEFFNTIYDNQFAVQVIVVQGEAETVGENRLIGSFLFELEQPTPKGTRCEIQLTYDVNGMIHVFASQLGTKNEAKAHFDSRTGEVSGWSSIEDEVVKKLMSMGNIQSLNEDSTDTESYIQQKEFSETNNNLLSFNFGKVSEKINDHEFQTDIVNGLILRAKRILAKLDRNSEDYSKILTQMRSYCSLLQEAKDGVQNDSQVDLVESELLLLLEGK